MNTSSRKPFRSGAYVATFADTAIREALAELDDFNRTGLLPQHGTCAALYRTLALTMGVGPSTVLNLTQSLILEEAAARWAREYDQAVVLRSKPRRVVPARRKAKKTKKRATKKTKKRKRKS